MLPRAGLPSDVIGVGLAPRGNDQPTQLNNASSSLVRFINDVATAYRLSGRQKPLFDEFAFHPNVNTDPRLEGLPEAEHRLREPRPAEAGALGRLQGTARPTPLEGSSVPKAITMHTLGPASSVSGLPASGYVAGGSARWGRAA